MIAAPERTSPSLPAAAMPGVLQARLNYDDYARMTPEGGKFQLIEGEIVEMPTPTPAHQELVVHLLVLLVTHVREHDLGKLLVAPMDVYLNAHNTLQPDILFISRENMSIIGDKKIEGAPDLVVEVLSPSTAYYDLKTKKRLYAEGGVREYWIIDLEEKNVEVYALENKTFVLKNQVAGEQILQSNVLPELQITAAKIFSAA